MRMPATRARGDHRGQAVARLTGIAAGYAHVGRMTRDEALAELAASLRKDGVTDPATARTWLTEAAALYVDRPPVDAWAWWAGQAAELIEEAGADLDAARQHPIAMRRRGRH